MMSSKEKKTSDSLLSTSTILILSGFLIGVTVGKLAADELSPYFLSCGLAGFLAFIALDIAATRRAEESANAEKRQMEERLDKHVLSQSSISFQLPEPVETVAEQSDIDADLKAASEILSSV